jgi:hypothetical protein
MLKWAFALGTLFAVSGFAQQNMDSKYFELTEPEVKLVREESLSFQTFSNTAIGASLCQGGNLRLLTAPAEGGVNLGDVLQDLQSGELILDQIMNIGKKIWDVIQAGKPVVNLKTDVATALPYGARCWLDLQTWQAPQARTYSVTYKNLYGIEVVKFSYRVVYVAGGSVNGKGAYIGYAALEPSEVSVAWGFTFNASSTAPTVFNMGTKEEPLAGLNLQMNYSIDTVLKSVKASQSYFINGLGEFRALD